MRTRLLCSLLTALCVLAPATASAAPPPIKHVFIVVLENENYDDSFGPHSQIPYLARTLVSRGQLLTHYFGTGHESLDNYITMVSGQPPNPYTQADAPLYVDFAGTVGSDGVAVGQGSVYPAEVKTVADQLEAKGLTWKGYMEDMNGGCQHPALGSPDTTQKATAQSQYATRHNPFVYFHSIIDRPACAQNDVPLDRLPGDLAKASSTASYSFITPDLCHDAHDADCADGGPGGPPAANTFLQTWVPRILGSPAYKQGGLLIVTFDESESGAEDCCNEPTGPNTPNNGGPTPGNGGGRTGTVLLSQFLRPGVANDTPYNHYGLLRSVEDIFGLGHLAYAARDDLKAFGPDVYNNPSGKPPRAVKPPKIRITRVPAKGCVRRAFTARVKITTATLGTARVMLDGRDLRRLHRKSFTIHVPARRLKPGRHRLTVRASQRIGPKGSRSARFRRC